jgi:hypothetical protein
MSNRLDKDREAELQPERMAFARERIEWMGYEITFQSDTEIRFVYKGSDVRLFPYSGWHTGKTIKDGRGIRKLLKQIFPQQ